MKKLLKAVALATVMCMLLSTAAFADSAELKEGTKLIDVNVADVGVSEQVVLLILTKDVAPAAATEADIMYIDQKQAGADEVATFENVAVKSTETEVDVYVGSAETGGPRFIATVDVTDVKVITIVGDPIVEYGYSGTDGVTKGVAAAITVDTKGLTIDKMIWGFTLNGERHYSESYVPTSTELLDGAVQFAAAFNLGATADDLEVSEVSAIFLTGEGTDKPTDHYTNEELDKPKKERLIFRR